MKIETEKKLLRRIILSGFISLLIALIILLFSLIEQVTFLEVNSEILQVYLLSILVVMSIINLLRNVWNNIYLNLGREENENRNTGLERR